MPTCQCPQCAAQYRMPENMSARKVRCKKCGTVFEIAADDGGLDFDDFDELAAGFRALPTQQSSQRSPQQRPPAQARGAGSQRRWGPAWIVAGIFFAAMMFIVLLAFVWSLGPKLVGWSNKAAKQVVFNNPHSVAQSKNNLKQIILAMHNYHDVYRMFPPGAIGDAEGKLHHSWQARLLPFVDAGPIYERINFNVPWDDPANAEAVAAQVRPYLHPSVGQTSNERGHALSHYAGSIHAFHDNKGLRIRDVTDGLSNTLIGGEVAAGFKPWGDPTNVRDPALGLNQGPDTFGSPGGGSTLFMIGDGSVRSINPEIDAEVLKALATPNGGEVVPFDNLAQ